MPVIYCNFNMFDANSSVFKVQEGKDTQELFKGSFEEIRNFITLEYHNNNNIYDRIVLAGPYAKTLENEIRIYSRIKYNFEDINIEVIE